MAPVSRQKHTYLIFVKIYQDTLLHLVHYYSCGIQKANIGVNYKQCFDKECQ